MRSSCRWSSSIAYLLRETSFFLRKYACLLYVCIKKTNPVFWSERSVILDLRSTNTQETVAFTISVRPKFGIGAEFRPKLWVSVSVSEPKFFFPKPKLFFFFFKNFSNFFYVFLLARGILISKNLKLNTDLQNLFKNLENLAANLV